MQDVLLKQFSRSKQKGASNNNNNNHVINTGIILIILVTCPGRTPPLAVWQLG